MADSDVASEAAKREVTRATVSVEKAAKDNPDCIMAVSYTHLDVYKRQTRIFV